MSFTANHFDKFSLVPPLVLAPPKTETLDNLYNKLSEIDVTDKPIEVVNLYRSIFDLFDRSGSCYCNNKKYTSVNDFFDDDTKCKKTEKFYAAGSTIKALFLLQLFLKRAIGNSDNYRVLNKTPIYHLKEFVKFFGTLWKKQRLNVERHFFWKQTPQKILNFLEESEDLTDIRKELFSLSDEVLKVAVQQNIPIRPNVVVQCRKNLELKKITESQISEPSEIFQPLPLTVSHELVKIFYNLLLLRSFLIAFFLQSKPSNSLGKRSFTLLESDSIEKTTKRRKISEEISTFKEKRTVMKFNPKQNKNCVTTEMRDDKLSYHAVFMCNEIDYSEIRNQKNSENMDIVINGSDLFDIYVENWILKQTLNECNESIVEMREESEKQKIELKIRSNYFNQSFQNLESQLSTSKTFFESLSKIINQNQK